MPMKLYDAMRVQAQKEGVSINDFFRDALKAYLRRNRGHKSPKTNPNGQR